MPFNQPIVLPVFDISFSMKTIMDVLISNITSIPPAFRLALLSHLGSILLLYTALLIPPSVLSQQKLTIGFLPAIFGCSVYGYRNGLGYLAFLHGLWSFELLGCRRVREEFVLVERGAGTWLGWGKGRNGAKGGQAKKEARFEGEKHNDAKENEKGDDKNIISELNRRAGPRGLNYQLYPTNFFSRLNWILKLLFSPRYVSWSTTPSASPNTALQSTIPSLYSPLSPTTGPLPSRILFLGRTTFLFFLNAFFFDLASFYQHFDPYFQISTSISEPLPRRLGSFFIRYHLGWMPARGWRIMVLGLERCSVYAMIHCVLIIACVSAGGLGVVGEFWGGVEAWPSLMGWTPLVIFESGLRGFWGSFWMGLFRNIFSAPGKALANALGFKRKTLPTYSLQVLLAFFLSGAVHSLTLLPNVPQVSPLRYSSFFWIQGGCIVLEIMLETFVKKRWMSIETNDWARRGTSVVRASWALGVLYWSVPIVEDEMVRVSRMFGLRQTVLFTLPSE